MYLTPTPWELKVEMNENIAFLILLIFSILQKATACPTVSTTTTGVGTTTSPLVECDYQSRLDEYCSQMSPEGEGEFLLRVKIVLIFEK